MVLLIFYMITIMYPSPWNLAGFQWRECQNTYTLSCLGPPLKVFSFHMEQTTIWHQQQWMSLNASSNAVDTLSTLCVDLALFRGSALNVLYCYNSFLIIRLYYAMIFLLHDCSSIIYIHSSSTNHQSHTHLFKCFHRTCT